MSDHDCVTYLKAKVWFILTEGKELKGGKMESSTEAGGPSSSCLKRLRLGFLLSVSHMPASAPHSPEPGPAHGTQPVAQMDMTPALRPVQLQGQEQTWV